MAKQLSRVPGVVTVQPEWLKPGTVWAPEEDEDFPKCLDSTQRGKEWTKLRNAFVAAAKAKGLTPGTKIARDEKDVEYLVIWTEALPDEDDADV